MPTIVSSHPVNRYHRARTIEQELTQPSVFARLGPWVLLFPLLYLLLEGTSSFLAPGDTGYGGVGQQTSFMQATVVPVWLRIVTALVWLICGFAVLSRLSQVLLLAWKMKAISALALLTVVSCVWSDDAKLTLLKSILFLVGTAFAYYLCERYEPNDLMEILIVLTVIAVAASILVCVLLPQTGVDIVGAWRGIFNHKNKLSRAILLLLPAMLNWKAQGGRHMLRAFFIGGGLILIGATLSRTGWLTTAGYLLFHLIFNYSRRIRRADAIALSFFILGSFLFLSAIVLTNFAEITRALGKDPTISGRTDIWHAAILAGLRQPFLGFGFGAFWRGIQGGSLNVYLATGYALWQGHNAYLDIWLDLGFVGLALFGIALLNAAKDAYLCLSSDRVREVNWYVETIFIILCLGLTEGQLVIHNSLGVLLFFIACIGLHKLRIQESLAKDVPTRRRSHLPAQEGVARGFA